MMSSNIFWEVTPYSLVEVVGFSQKKNALQTKRQDSSAAILLHCQDQRPTSVHPCCTTFRQLWETQVINLETGSVNSPMTWLNNRCYMECIHSQFVFTYASEKFVTRLGMES